MRWLMLLCCLSACTKDVPKAEYAGQSTHHSFDDAEAWAARFEDPARDAWQRPDDVLKTLALPPTASVADIGAATGYFSVRFSKALPQGTVYGIDVESSMVDYLKNRAEREKLPNLQVILAAYDDAKIPQPVDLILVVDTYHHISDRTAYFAGLYKSLKPDGRIAIIDFNVGSKKGPPDNAKIEPAQVTRELTNAGFALRASHTFLPEQYFLVFSR